MKKLKIVIFSLIIIILIFIVAIMIFGVVRQNQGTDGTISEEALKFENNNNYKINNSELAIVRNANEYYVVKDIVDSYVKNVNDLYYYDAQDINPNLLADGEKETVIKERKEEAIDKLNDNLAKNYLEEKEVTEITMQNYTEYVNDLKNDSLVIDNMYYYEKTPAINIFIVYGHLKNNFEEKFDIIVVTDSENSVFEIYPQDYMEKYQYMNLKEGDVIDIQIGDIVKKEYNTFNYSNISNERVAQDYFNEFKQLMQNDSAEAYELLDEEYRNKRFGSLEAFQTYLNNNRNEIEKTILSKYLVNNYENYTEYVCYDNYGNFLIFDATAIKKYTVKLDTYTIPTDKFKQQYDNGETQTKVMMNVDKWVDMLNNRDYTAAYNVLDETFRNNTFGSEEAFEAYMRENYPLHYSVEYSTYKEEMNTFVQTIYLKDITNQSTDSKQLTIIMQLKDNYDFVMSFS